MPTICSIITLSLYLDMTFSDAFFLLQGRMEIVNGELTIHRVQQTDSGMYQCVAGNKYGSMNSNAELKILGNFTFCLFFIFVQKGHLNHILCYCYDAKDMTFLILSIDKNCRLSIGI